MPSLSASSRDDQCVTPSFLGGGFNVSATIARWSNVRGRPDRWASLRPSSPLAWYRSRHDSTVVTVASTSSAILVFAVPSAASNTIRARFAADAGTVEDRVQRSSSSRSPGRNTNAGAGRFAMPQHFKHQPSRNLRHGTLGGDGRKVQVKSRLVEAESKGTQQYSPFRSWDFDVCVFVTFDAYTYDVTRGLEVPT